MRRFLHFYSLLGLLFASNVMAAPAGSYRIVQITTDQADHRWPAINNRGDIVWSQQVGGKWQVFRRSGPVTSSSTGSNINATDGPNHNYKYAVISDIGDIVYLRDNNPQNNAGSDLQVVRNHNNVETVLEYSSRNINLTLGIAAAHTAGSHFSIASDGTTLSYYDFTQTGAAPVRRFDLSGSQLKDSNGAARNLAGIDYPGINANAMYVYSDGTGVWKAPIAGGSPIPVDRPGDQGSAPTIADGSDPEVVYIKTPQFTNADIASGTVMSQKGKGLPVEVHHGSWAGVNKSGMIVFEDIVGSNRQIFLAIPVVHLLDPVSDLISGTGITSDLNALATAGREVEGVAADGVSRVVVRIDATGLDSANLELLDESNIPISDASFAGTLSKRDGGSSSSSLSLTPETANSGQKVFLAIYQAPAKFIRPGSTDTMATSRIINLHVRLTASGQSADVYSPTKIVRPPVFLVHGVWATSATWSGFGELASSNNDSRFYVGRSDYASDGNVQNASVKVAQDLVETLRLFKTTKAVAAVQVIVVAHGMGALVMRTVASNASFQSDPPTFGVGPVNKMITIAGVHQGAAMANYLLEQPCVAGVLANSLFSRPAPMGNGAVQDLAEGSVATCQVNSQVITPFPVHTISGKASLAPITFVEAFLNAVGGLACGTLPQSDIVRLLGSDHDLFVRTSSQSSGSSANESVSSVFHAPPFQSLAGDRGETVDPGISNRVVALLDSNTPSDFAPLAGVAPKAPDYDSLVGLCSSRSQNNIVPHVVDGCSIPDPVFSDPQDPMKGDFGDRLLAQAPTAFGRPQPNFAFGEPLADLPCNKHDICYQTCAKDKTQCDNALRADIETVCGAAYPPGCPVAFDQTQCNEYGLQRLTCFNYAKQIQLGVQLGGGSSYRERQLAYCKCCR